MGSFKNVVVADLVIESVAENEAEKQPSISSLPHAFRKSGVGYQLLTFLPSQFAKYTGIPEKYFLCILQTPSGKQHRRNYAASRNA